MATDHEPELARFTQWIRQRPNAIEFWELVVTDERLVWCFVGESYRSMLLRADMGERDRAIVGDSSPDELEALADENFSVPIEALAELRLTTGTRLRRPQLEVAWSADDPAADRERWTLYGARNAPSHEDLVADLATDPRLDHVDVRVEEPRFPFL